MSDDGTKKYWQTLRTFTTQASESGVPATSGFVTVDWGGNLPDEIEVRFDPMTVTGTPDAVYFNVWRYLGEKVDKIYAITYASDDYDSPIPVNLKFDADSIYVTVSYSGGTSPSVSTACQIRVIK